MNDEIIGQSKSDLPTRESKERLRLESLYSKMLPDKTIIDIRNKWWRVKIYADPSAIYYGREICLSEEHWKNDLKDARDIFLGRSAIWKANWAILLSVSSIIIHIIYFIWGCK